MNTDAVILAAGYSSRAEAFKMELLLEEKPILQKVIDAFLPICRQIIVVGGYRIEKIYPLVRQYEDKVEVVRNEAYQKGMFSSVKKGIEKVSSSQFFLTPGDYPFITTDICKSLLQYSGELVKPVFHNRGGHPILLQSCCIPEILKEAEDSNLKLYLDKKKLRTVEMKDDSILLDIDTPADYEIAKQRVHKL